MNNHDLYDAYTALGINPTNDISAVKKAYRDMARRYHPDLHRGDKAYDDRCKIINIAYRKIIDALPRISHLSDSGKTSHFNDPGTNNDLDDLIASMSPDDRFHRCFADIPDADNGVARKYVLTSLYIGKDRGFMLVSNGLGLHADIAKAFFDDLHRRKVPVSNLDILGVDSFT